MGDAACKSKIIHGTFGTGPVLANSCVFFCRIINANVRIAGTLQTGFVVGDGSKALLFFMNTMNLLDDKRETNLCHEYAHSQRLLKDCRRASGRLKREKELSGTNRRVSDQCDADSRLQ